MPRRSGSKLEACQAALGLPPTPTGQGPTGIESITSLNLPPLRGPLEVEDGSDLDERPGENECPCTPCINAYGTKLLLTIICTHHLLKGFVGGGGMSGLVGHAMEFTFRDDMGLKGPRLQVLTAVAALPWSMKAMMGLFSDGFPICGLRKAPYLVVATILALGAYSNLAFTKELGEQVGAASFFMVFFQMALADLLVEAKYSEKVKAVPQRGPDLITFVWGGISAFSILAASVSGVLIEHVGPRWCYMISLPFAAVLLVPVCRNYLEETRPDGAVGCQLDVEVWSGKGRVPFALALVSGTVSLGLLAFTLLVENVELNFVAAACAGFLNLSLYSIFLRPVIAKMNAFFFLQSMFHIGTAGAAVYFFTDEEDKYPAGPHFSRQFYVTGIGSVASLFSLIGTLCYNCFAKTWRYRSLLMSTSLAYAVVNCLACVVYKRVNLQFGIPDNLFMLASTSMQHVIGQLAWMPMTVMIAQLVPQGIESVMYALLAGSLNFGNSLANFIGAMVLQTLGVTPKGDVNDADKFDNLWIAALISACGPLVPLILVNFLIPDLRQTDRLLDGEDDGSATTGSLFEQVYTALQNRWKRRYTVMKREASMSAKPVPVSQIEADVVGNSSEDGVLS